MAGRKRAAEDSAEGPSTRSSKTAKTETKKAPAAKGGRKRGPKTSMAASQFTAQALPLHVNLTHTPPVLDASEEGKDGAVSVSHTDPGFVGTTTLVPSVFSTGSYGWKGNKRLTIELPNPNGSDKEKVHVMLTINATVMGSKDAAASEEADEAKEVEAAVEEAKEDAVEEVKEAAEAAEEDAVAEGKNGKDDAEA